MQDYYKINNIDITPKRDIVFKRIFGAKGNEGILKDFLEAILEIKIDSLELDLATELLPDFYDGKKCRVDVRTRLSNGAEVHIEIQMDSARYSEKRGLQYWSKIYSNTLKEGKNYNELKKTICIWILDGKVYDEFEDFDSKWEIMNAKYGIRGHFEDLEFHVIELKKLRESDIIKPTKKEFWLWFIDYTNEELVRMSYVNNEKIKEAREQLDKIRADEELMERIRLQELAEWDENTSIANAKREGMKSAKEEVIKNLLKLNMPIEQISDVTGVSKEEILKIKEIS